MAASIGLFGLDPRRASLRVDIAVDVDKLEAKGAIVHPRDIEVSIYYSTGGNPEGDPERETPENR